MIESYRSKLLALSIHFSRSDLPEIRATALALEAIATALGHDDQPEFQCGNLRIMHTKLSIWKGREIRTGPRECSALRYLASNANRISRREDIFLAHSGKEIHMINSGALSRSVDMIIEALRRKLRRIDPHTEVIRTIRSRGYLWNDPLAGVQDAETAKSLSADFGGYRARVVHF